MDDGYKNRALLAEAQVERLLDERNKLASMREQYMERMEEAVNNGDTEAAHGDADGILCELLSDLGYGELIGLYCKVDKWYA